MSTLTVYGDTADTEIYDNAATYAGATDATSVNIKSISDTNARVGQNWDSGTNYTTFHLYMGWDTSPLGSTAVISAASFWAYVVSNLTATDFIAQMRLYDWGSSVDSADAKTPTAMGNLTLLATLDTSGITTGGYTWTENGTNLRSNVNKTGYTRVILTSSRYVSSTTPTQDEYLYLFMADYSGTTYDPKLTITYTFTTIVIPTAASLTTTRYAPTVRGITTFVSPARALLTLTGYAPRFGPVVTPVTATLTLTAYAPTVTIVLRLSPSAGELVLTGYAPMVRVPTPPSPQAAGTVNQWFRYEQRTNAFGYRNDLTPAVLEATIDLDNTRSIVRTAKFKIDSSKLPASFDPDTDNVSVTAYQLEDGEAVAYTLGTFRLDAQSEALFPNDISIWEAEGSELSVLLQQARVDGPYTLAAGTEVVAAIRTLCAEEGVEQEFPYDLSTLPIGHTWDAGTPKLTVINDLLESIHWFPAYDYWGRGELTSRYRTMPHQEIPDVVYSTTEPPRMILPPFERGQNTGSIANRVTVKIEDPTRDPPLIWASSEDDRIDSPTSTFNNPLSEVEASSAIYQSAALIATISEYMVREAAASALEGSLRTTSDLRRKPHETYRLHIEGVEESTIWRVWGWSLTLRAGAEMQHTLGRVTPFYVTPIT